MIGRAGRGRRIGLLVFVPVLVVFVVWAADDGGYAPTRWYPGALVLLALAGGVAVAAPALAWPSDRVVLAAQALFGAYTIWTFASISWATARGDAWDGADRTLLYLMVFVAFSSWRWSLVSALGFIGMWAGGVVVVCGIELARAASASEPASFFPYGRFSEPFGYANANAAALVMAFWPLVACAQARWLAPLLRGLALALAGTAIELALLAQSRGSMLAFPVVIIVFLALSRQRLRAAAAVGLALAPALILRHPLLDVYTALLDRDEAVDNAARAVGLTAGALFGVGLAAAVADSKLTLTRPRTRALARIATVGAAAAVAVGGVAFADVYGSPRSVVARAWQSFKDPGDTVATASRFTSTSGNHRYDFWRVALLRFRDHPFRGVGVDNFAVDYIHDRRSTEQPLYPHSIVIRLFSQTGLVGAALMLGALGAAIAGAAPVLRSSAGRSVGAATGALLADWLLHGAFDWFWEFPGLTAPAFAALGILATFARGPGAHVVPPRIAVRAVVAAPLLAAAAGVLLLPFLAARDVQDASAVWRGNPGHAYDKLAQARRLNPLSDQPDLTAGAIASRRREWPTMERSFARALERNDENWYAWFRLGVARAMQNERLQALQALERARRLDPREPVIPDAIRTLRRGGVLDPRTLDRGFVDPVIAASGQLW